MLSICLRDTNISVAIGTLKNDSLNIQRYEKYSGTYLHYLENIRSEEDVDTAAQNLSYLFSDIFSNSSMKKESEVYIVLPDYLFTSVDCFKYYNDEEIKNNIASKLVDNNLENYYYNTPVFTKPTRVEKMVTAYVINKNIIDCFIKAAQMSNISILSIEAMSMSFLRSLSKFEREEIFLEVFDNNATLIGYSAIAGLFKMDVPELAKNNLSAEDDSGNNTILENIATFETTADFTFDFFNPDLPIYILSGKNYIKNYSAINKRINTNFDISDLIKYDRVVVSDACPFMATVGTMLQGVDFTSEKFESLLAANQLLLSGNVIPEEIKSATKLQLMLGKINKISIYSIAVLAIGIIAELVVLFFFSSVSIPTALQQEYKTKQESIKDIDTGLKLIEKYSSEHEYPTLALKHIINNKPNKVYFTNFIIDEHRKGQVGNKWIELRAVSENPILFQDFLIALASDSLFKNIIIPQISSDPSGYKKATFIISKGDVKN